MSGLVLSQPAVVATAPAELRLPALITAAGEKAEQRFIEFFSANIRNPNTRAAYVRAASDFFVWMERADGNSLADIEPIHVAAWVEQLGRVHAVPTVKQHLAAVRMLFDWLVVGQIVASNPAAAVRGPKHVVKRGKTPVLSTDEARTLLESIDTATTVGLRDRALIGLLVYTFARIGAAVAMRVGDYYPLSKRWWVRLHEKGGKHHEMPTHHKLEGWLDVYLRQAAIVGDAKGPLFRTARGRTGQLTGQAMSRNDALRMIGRRARDAGILTPVTCHTFRATGITAYLDNGGTLEKAQLMAAHESPRTTKLYDRTADAITLEEIERIRI